MIKREGRGEGEGVGDRRGEFLSAEIRATRATTSAFGSLIARALGLLEEFCEFYCYRSQRKTHTHTARSATRCNARNLIFSLYVRVTVRSPGKIVQS